MQTTDERPKAAEEEKAQPAAPKKVTRRHLDVAIIIMLAVVLVMVIALVVEMLLRVGLIRLPH
jgi:hypothetical protein